MVLLETRELLLHKHSTTIVEVMCGQILQVLHAHPPVHPLLLANELVFRIHAATYAQKQHQPEASVFGEFHSAIVVHRMRRSRDIETSFFVSEHVSLKLNSVLRVDDFRIWMIEVVEVVRFGRMERSWHAYCSASGCTSALLRNATPIQTKVVDIVLLALLLELGKAGFSVAASSGSRLWDIACLVTRSNVIRLIELLLTDLSVLVWILLPQKVIVRSRLHY